MSGRRPDEAILAVEVLRGGVRDQARAKSVVVRLGDRPVDGAPPDLVVARRVVDDELVLRRTSGVLAGPHDERALCCDEALAVPDGVLVQLGGREVGADGSTQKGSRGWCGRGHRLVDSCGMGDHGLIDRPRVMRATRLAGVGFRSRKCSDANTLRDGIEMVAAKRRRWGGVDTSTRRAVAATYNRRALSKSGRGAGPLKPRQPTDESARCQARAGPPAR